MRFCPGNYPDNKKKKIHLAKQLSSAGNSRALNLKVSNHTLKYFYYRIPGGYDEHRAAQETAGL